MSTSLQQLPPVSRYYIRRLLQQSIEAADTNGTGQGGVKLKLLGASNTEIDQSIEELLNQDGQAEEKLAELERLALLFQGLSTQGTAFSAQMMSRVEHRVANLLGLELGHPLVQPLGFEPPANTAPTHTASATSTTPTVNSTPNVVHSLAAIQNTDATLLMAAAQSVGTPKLMSSEYLARLNKVSQMSQKFVGNAVTAKTWRACRPDDTCIAQVQVSEAGELYCDGEDFVLNPEQKASLKIWRVEFIRHSSRVIRNFEQILKASGILVPNRS